MVELQWQFLQRIKMFTEAFISTTNASSGQSEIARIWQTSVCLSYPHFMHPTTTLRLC